MAETQSATYTAKLTDGPLEGKTITTRFLESGDARPRVEIPAGSGGKHYVYSRSSGVEYASDAPTSVQPSAVEYRFIEAIFD